MSRLTFKRVMEIANALAIPCAHCGVAAGALCVWPKGHPNQTRGEAPPAACNPRIKASKVVIADLAQQIAKPTGECTRDEQYRRSDAVLIGANRRGRLPCPDCSHEGPHSYNDGSGDDLTFCCSKCGMHFDSILVRDPADAAEFEGGR